MLTLGQRSWNYKGAVKELEENLEKMMSLSARAAIVKYHTLGGT